MSDPFEAMTGGRPGDDGPRPAGHRRAERPSGPSWGRRLLVLLVLLAVVAGGWFAYGKVKDFFSGPEDYVGEGTGEVLVEIPQDATGQAIANVLYEADVVKSAEAFYQLSLADPRAQAIQPGFYQLRKQMSAEAALTALSDKGNKVEAKVTIPEGSRLDAIAKAIAKNSEITVEQVEAAFEQPDAIGLPPEANGNPEGFLYPATYVVTPGMDAVELLKQMVAKTVEVEKRLDIETRAQAVGLTKTQVMTLASILEYEANQDADYPKVARVFLNRLERGIALQSDATVSYANGITGDVWTTPEQRANQSEYNTYVHQGLPPGPIGAAGEKTIEAVLNPADGDWLYFVPDYENNTTVFSTTLAEHERAVAKLKAWCSDPSKDEDDIC
ncbi:MAG TPA: endolytic transglycosylase MltG [Aeromicrobium sp.]|nr:endolytic transglycosylase MltG [Aeromicrobium sp.]